MEFLVNNYCWLLIVGAPSVLFLPMLLSGEVLFWGTPLLQFVPWREFAFDVLREGHLPLWNPWLGMGAPLIANYQSALFYPPNLILFITGAPWGHGLLAFLHVLWTGIGMMLLVRRLCLGKLPQVIAGLGFSLSGYVIARAGFLSINAAVSWLPWIVLAAENLLAHIDRENIQWLAGHAQTSWYCLLLLLVWVTWRSFERGRWPYLFRTLIALSVAGLIAFLLSAIQLLPTAEYLFHSHRAGEVERELAYTYSFWPWRLLGLLMPNLFGNPATGDYWGYANFWEDAIYFGVLPLILAIFAIRRGMRHRKFSSLILMQIILIISSFVFALGKNTPIFPFLFENVPTFDLFQAPTRWTVILEFALVLLAAIGAELWQQKEVLRLFWVRLGTAGGAATVLFALIVGGILPEIKNTFSSAVVLAGFGVMVTGLLAWRRRIQPSVFWPVLIAAFVALDLTLAGLGLNPSVSKAIYREQSQLTETVSSENRIYMSAAIEQQVKFEWTHRFDTFYPEVDWDLVRESGLPNTPLLDKIPSANNFDPILPDRYAVWMKSLETLPETQLEQVLRSMDVGWRAEIVPSSENQIQYTKIQNPSHFTIVGEAIWVENAEPALHLTLMDDFDFLNAVILEGSPIIPDVTNPDVKNFELIQSRDPNRIQIEMDISEDGWLVISETYFPGWRAAIDGESVKIYHANYLFKALRIPAGEHKVELRYQPMSFVIGCVLSAISWCLLGVLWWKLKKE